MPPVELLGDPGKMFLLISIIILLLKSIYKLMFCKVLQCKGLNISWWSDRVQVTGGIARGGQSNQGGGLTALCIQRNYSIWLLFTPPNLEWRLTCHSNRLLCPLQLCRCKLLSCVKSTELVGLPLQEAVAPIRPVVMVSEAQL